MLILPSVSAVVLATWFGQIAEQQPARPAPGTEPLLTVAGQSFFTWREYTASEAFRSAGLRCGGPTRDARHGPPPGAFAASSSDCGYGSNTPDPAYAPTSLIDIPVVVHVIQHNNGNGYISPAMVQSQIDILNEDFRALAGTLGGNGNDAMIQFHLATEDPAGNPTTGITYSINNSWYNDNGSYWNSLGWDTDRYLNIYTNTADGALGYVPDIPQGGVAGTNSDRVVVLWSSFGRNAPIGPPFDKGRTTTHEVGHYLGLYHTFDNGCGSVSNCSGSGDLICDTGRESAPHYGCPGSASSCGGTPAPIRNYMNYTDDTCMQEFTPDQILRMRCTLQFWRPDLGSSPAAGTWDDLGDGTSGVAGVPSLVGTGDLTGGSSVSLELTGAAPSALAILFIATSSTPVPFLGGTLHAFPITDQFITFTSPGGGFLGNTVWPGGMPSGTRIWWQFGVDDGSVPLFNASLSNGLRSTTP